MPRFRNEVEAALADAGYRGVEPPYDDPGLTASLPVQATVGARIEAIVADYMMLQKLLVELEERIGPVLLPESPTGSEVQEDGDKLVQSPLRNWIDGVQRQSRRLSEQISDLIRRVDL